MGKTVIKMRAIQFTNSFGKWSGKTILLGSLLSLLLAAGCSISTGSSPGAVPSAQSTEQAKAGQTAATAEELDPNSLQAINDRQRAREALPGRGHYDRACASCHEGAVKRAPHRQMLLLMTPEAVLQALTTGLMSAQASSLSDQQKREVAEYIGGRPLGESSSSYVSCSANASAAKSLAGGQKLSVRTQNWGFTHDNKRHLPASVTALNKDNASSLKTRWAFAFDGANRARSQPLYIGDMLITGSHNGEVLALDQQSGCVRWSFQASSEVRTAIVADPTASSGSQQLYFGDVLGNVYAINALTGAAVWRTRADDHPNATITGTPSLYEDRLYVPVSALEVSNAMDPLYECCTFRGSVVALDRANGKIDWQSYTIEQEPVARGKNPSGATRYGPSGAVVWNSPSIDIKRRRLYVGTGENASSPATDTSDAIIAMNLADGSIAWSWQGTSGDAWNTACGTDQPDNCPEEDGPDYDFGAATLIATTKEGQDLVVGGQKSGLVHAIDADTGKLKWSTRVGRGGIQGGVHFGIAADDKRVYVPISDMADGVSYPDPDRPGVHALDIETGEALWYARSPDACNGRDFCHPGVSQSISVVNDMVLAGGMDGVMRGYNSATGEQVYELDSTQEFKVTDAITTKGGSFGGGAGPVAQGNTLVLSSGYGMYNHMAGNLLLMLELPKQ